MSAAIPWIIVSALLLLLFLTFMVLGVIRQKVNLVIAGVACLLLLMGTGSVAAWKLVQGTASLVAEAAKEHTGPQIYASILGQPSACVQVFASSSPIITTRPHVVSACFATCPQEAARALRAHPFEVIKIPWSSVNGQGPIYCDTYFSPERFGDTLLECIASTPAGTCTLYLSTDSTHGFFVVKN